MARIEDHAIIGDGATAALVTRDGSIDWLCWPRFDSPACFAALLGSDDHGRWSIAPVSGSARITRRYREDTLVLETEFETPEGTVALIDFMPARGDASSVVRIVEGRSGRVEMHTRLILRFGYGAVVPWVSRMDDGSIRAIAGPDLAMLHSDVPLHGEGLSTVGAFAVGAGERVRFVLTHGASHLPMPRPVAADDALRTTERFWREWTSRCTYHGEHRDAVICSLITLKALIYAPTGGIVAAPTTSLPELLQGTRNWDYRYCWLRDATLTLLALMDAGYFEEAEAWRDWLLRAVAGLPSQLQIMYGVGGERHLREWTVEWLPGYEGSAPVRIGNAAHSQLQLDVFGELFDAMYQARRGGVPGTHAGWSLQRALVDHLRTVWREPDEGIWEVRGERQHFTHSKVMAWVAVDRAIRSAEEFDLDGPLDEWRALRSAIHADVCEKGFDHERGSFVQAYGSRLLDASLLLIPLVGFLPPDDARVLGTVAAIERELVVDGIVRRYDTAATDDGLPPGEGAFLACSFWLADTLALIGRTSDAEALFRRLLKLRNDVGLLAEEYDTQLRRQVGNFPQAFSHVALIDTAFNLSHASKPGAQRAADGHER